MNRETRIYAFTRIYFAAEFFKNDTPFLLAVIEKGENRILARVEEAKGVKIGASVVKTEKMIAGQSVYRLK